MSILRRVQSSRIAENNKNNHKLRNRVNLLSSRLYCWFWNCTKSCALARADCTANRELHPALKITNIQFVRTNLLYSILCGL